MRNEFNYMSYSNLSFDQVKASDIYKELIILAKSDTISGYTEKHHIVPKCLGGSNDSSNLVSLTYSEHIFAHYLLAIINFPNQNLILPFLLMSNSKKKQIKTIDEVQVDFKLFESFSALREKGYQLQSEKNKANDNIGKVNLIYKDEFYNKKVLSGRYKKYNIVINNLKKCFTRKELKTFFEENNITSYTNVYTNRTSNNIKQFLNHIERFVRDGYIKIIV